MTKPKNDHAIPREMVVCFAMHWFQESRDRATRRVRRTLWGYVINTQSWEFITTQNYDYLLFGNGPILVGPTNGEIYVTSSSPGDLFGEYGYANLETAKDFKHYQSKFGGNPIPTIIAYLSGEDSRFGC